MRTYDILNAGPRHRFMANGRIVSNSGRTVQLQNLPSRGLLKQKEIEFGIQAMLAQAEDLVFDDVMKLTASTIRSVIIAPEGQKLVVADLANIEGRDLAWLAGESWKLQAFRDYDTFLLDENGQKIFDGKDDFERMGPDLYKLAYAKAFGISPRDVDKVQRSIGKVMELFLGYAGGIGAFLTGALGYGIDLEAMADGAWDTLPADVVAEAEDFLDWMEKQKRTFPLSRKAATTCEVFKRLWRNAHPMTVKLWDEVKQGFVKATRNPGVTYSYRGLKFRRDGAWLRIQIPSGRCLCYPHPEVDDNGQCSYMGVNQFSRKWCRIKTHGGKLVENCIAEGTPVLTHVGWVPIEQVTTAHLIWDGIEFVANSGCSYSGKLVVSEVYGVQMTADHKVLTEEGWRNASTCKGYNRAPCRLPDSDTLRRVERSTIAVGDTLRLRDSEADGPFGIQETRKEGGRSFLWLPTASDDSRSPHDPRHVAASGLCGMAQHARPLSSSYTSRLEKLWRTGDTCLRALVDFFRGVLAGHGPHLPGGPDDRAGRQQRKLHTRELPMENYAAPSEQYSKEPSNRHASWPDDNTTSRGGVRPRDVNTGVPGSEWLASRAVVRAVWDIQNCGPRNRFAVQGADGGMLIVHNCTQSNSRDVLFDRMAAIEDAGYAIRMRVHDELITTAPDTDEYSSDELARLMSINPDWATGLPLAAAGFESYRYRK